MIIIDSNLEHLVAQYKICDKSLVDNFSLKIQMGLQYYEVNESRRGENIIFGVHPNPGLLFSENKKITQNLLLAPGAQVISCSRHRYKIPHDYFGLVQTKGTLARLFVQTTCNDGQVEPGFDGYVTLEIINMSPWTIEIPVGSDIAQLYLIKCSSPAASPYNGRYAEIAKDGPTLAIFS